jgi:hypothetical protein
MFETHFSKIEVEFVRMVTVKNYFRVKFDQIRNFLHIFIYFILKPSKNWRYSVKL